MGSGRPFGALGSFGWLRTGGLPRDKEALQIPLSPAGAVAMEPPATADSDRVIDVTAAPAGDGPLLLLDFKYFLLATEKAHVLELGTKRSQPEVSTAHQEWARDDATFVLSDFQEGLDVDVVADIHNLSSVFAPDSFDAVICCSVLEHVQRPWLAVAEIAKVLKPRGQVCLQTHFAFPVHGYPSDYWRFTREALELLCSDAGLTVLRSAYEFPCRVMSHIASTGDPWSYMNVLVVAEKPQVGTGSNTSEV